jgi:hydroxymethylbilane synthase
MINKIKIGTRGSNLALWQANFVKNFLEKNRLVDSVEIVEYKTTGDINLSDNLDVLGGKGVFVKEIEEGLIRKEIDIAVHSYKDLPSELPEDLEIIATSPREDCRDVLISKNIQLKDLHLNCKIGTGSKRRTFQLNQIRDDIEIVPIRGNIETRVGKVLDNELDAIILAGAALIRLGLTSKITSFFSADEIVPSPLQGFIAIEARKDSDLASIFSLFCSDIDKIISKYERRVLTSLNGSCFLPFGFNLVNYKEEFICSYFLNSNDQTIKDSVIIKNENIDYEIDSIIAKLSTIL